MVEGGNDIDDEKKNTRIKDEYYVWVNFQGIGMYGSSSLLQ